MIAVLAMCVLGPFSAVYVLGYSSSLLLLAVGGMLGVTLGLGVVPGTYRLPDQITTGVVAICVALFFLLLIYMTLWTKLEAYFCYTPWLRHNGKMQTSENGRKFATRCPFTGNRPTHRCPNCDARVHESAFHKTDRLISLPVGETVLNWEGAKLATEQTGDLAKARRTLDTYLDYRGNTIFATLAACCAGCSTWQRCFNLLPRLSLCLAFCAMFFAFIPWAFASFLSGSGSMSTMGRSVIGGGGAKAVHVICDVLACVYAEAALLIQVLALLRANDFLATHRHHIPSFKPLFPSPKAAWFRRMIWAPWEQKV